MPRIMVSKGFHVPKIFICTCISILISIILFIILLWLVIHPKTPHFTLLQAQIYQLNLSNPNHLLSSSIKITIESKNPNTKVGACYDELHTYASYKSQPITDHATILPFFQGQQESNIFTISLGASGLPVAPTFGFDLGRDMVVGKMVVVLKVDGRLRGKIGSWVYGGYRIDVGCVAFFKVDVTGSGTATQASSECQ